VRKPFPDWVGYTPNSMWIYDTTHFPAAGMAVLIIEDLFSRKWITEIVSVEETSTQVELAFTAALDADGLLEARHDDGRVDLGVGEESRPILLAISDNGAQMTSSSTREFMALCAIAQHFGRPGTPTDQAWIESLNGHVKIDYPHPLAIP
jgi:putative transposase